MKPKGVAVDSGGNIYVCDSLRDAVQVYAQDRGYFLSFGQAGQLAGEFWMPSGLYIDRKDTIYVADTYKAGSRFFSISTPRQCRGNRDKGPLSPRPKKGNRAVPHA